MPDWLLTKINIKPAVDILERASMEPGSRVTSEGSLR
jgi:hypothetical protein